jgi:hypothetical protein
MTIADDGLTGHCTPGLAPDSQQVHGADLNRSESSEAAPRRKIVDHGAGNSEEA